MPKLATPRWNGHWNGDSGPLLDAAEAAIEVLHAADIEIRTAIRIDWGDGQGDEASIADGRVALSREPKAPEGFEVTLISSSGDAGVDSVSVHAGSGLLFVSARGADFSMTERVFRAAQERVSSTAATTPDGAESRSDAQAAYFYLEREWRQWAGSLRDLADAGRLAADELGGWDPNQLDIHGWGVKAEITVCERKGLTSNFSDVAELPTVVDPRDLGNIKTVVIDVSRLKPRARVTITAAAPAFRNGMEFAVGGEDRTRVEGLMHRLEALLVPRERLGLLVARNTWLISATVIFWIALLGIGLVLKYAFGVPPVTRIAVAASSSAALALAAGLLAWASPTLEILDPGSTPRFQRWRAKVLAAVGALVVGVIGSVLATVIYSGG
jgi:hypothetical protein